MFVSFQQASGVCQVGSTYHAIYAGNERRLWPQVTVSCELVACSVKAWLQSECGVRSKQVSGEVYFHELARLNRGIGGGRSQHVGASDCMSFERFIGCTIRVSRAIRQRDDSLSWTYGHVVDFHKWSAS